jgi:glucose-1-phosphate cytidylyltransferase
MGEESASIPKPMVPIGNRPILWHIMKYYAHYGHTEFILCLGHKAEAIKRFFLEYNEALANDFVLSNGGREVDLLSSDISTWRITFVDTGLQSSIGQRLRAVRKHLEGDEVFLATYGDAVTNAPLNELVDSLVASDSVANFLCVRPSTYSFHTVAIDRGMVTEIEDVTQADIWINGGFFVFRKDILDYLEEAEDLVDGPLRKLIASRQLMAHRYEGFWAPMDTLKDKQNLDALFEGGDAPWEVWQPSAEAEAATSS